MDMCSFVVWAVPGWPQLAHALILTSLQLAVVGILEVLPKLREFFKVADLAEEILRQHRPRAVVLVDFPALTGISPSEPIEWAFPSFTICLHNSGLGVMATAQAKANSRSCSVQLAFRTAVVRGPQR